MPKRRDIFFIVAIKSNFKIIDYSMKLDKSFIYRDRGINSGKKQVDGKFVYMYEDTMMRVDEETNLIKKIREGTKTQKDLEEERPGLGKFSILSNMDDDPENVYGMYKMREEVEQAFDAMKNELENDKVYLHTVDGVREYFFLSFISLYIYFRILETLKTRNMSSKISVKETLRETSKIYAMVHGARISTAEIPEKTQKMANIFGLKLSPKIVWN
ncbi:transposase [mine drainage metagenome]|uniref:Transposase n=1 Tax=mine drainage metagenome TaxID=410659 RepID=T0ZK63_9ZZZZ